jgi:hypothetical protein
MLEAIRAELASVYFISLHAREQANRVLVSRASTSEGTPP